MVILRPASVDQKTSQNDVIAESHAPCECTTWYTFNLTYDTSSISVLDSCINYLLAYVLVSENNSLVSCRESILIKIETRQHYKLCTPSHLYIIAKYTKIYFIIKRTMRCVVILFVIYRCNYNMYQITIFFRQALLLLITRS